MIGVFSFSGIRRLHSDAFGINHVAQEQPLSGRAAARKRQVSGRQDAFELLGRVSAASHVDQRADYGAYHVAQETVGAYGEDEHITLAAPLGARHMTYVGLVVGVEFGERGEVVVPQKRLGGAIHAPDIERHVILPRREASERVLALRDVIRILALDGIETGMRVVGNGRHCRHGYVVRQDEIEFVYQLGAVGHGLRAIEMGHIIRGVDPRVGTPRAHRLHLLAQQGGQRLFQCVLHRGRRGLALPSAVCRAVVTEFYKVTHDSME